MKRIKQIAFGLTVLLSGGLTAGAVTFETVGSNITSDARWTRDKVYLLTRVVFVANGANLTIEPGTVVRGIVAGPDGSDLINEPGTLVVTRGSKMIANGTPDAPIVFTSIDDPNVPGGSATVPAQYTNSQGNVKTRTTDGLDGNYGFDDYAPDGDGPSVAGGADGLNGFAYNGRWGGLVVLGNGLVGQNTENLPGMGPAGAGDLTIGASRNSGVGQDYVEGIEPGNVPDVGPDNPAGGDSNGIEFLGVYGGADDTDNCGVYRFLSIRYSGFLVGDANEINSFTAGGLGSDTVIEFVESSFNRDDGFEFFGGTNDTRFLFANYIADDSFDADEGFRGNHQFWSAVQGSRSAVRVGFDGPGNGLEVGPEGSNSYDHVFEIDGSEPSNAGGLPATQLNVWNLTALSAGSDEAIRYRDGANGDVTNAVIEFSVNNEEPFTIDSDAGTVNAENVHFTGGSAIDTGSSLIERGEGINSEGSAQLRGKGIYTKNGLDPRLVPGANSAVSDGPVPPVGLVPVSYAGFQRENTFLSGWSHVSYLEVLPEGNLARPVVSLGMSGTNPTVSFESAGADVLYVIERSADQRTWSPVTVVSGAGTLSHTDSDVELAAGAPVYYRAYGL